MAGDGSVKLIDEKTGKRTDGRKFNELRPTKIEVGVLNNADGSALIYMGNNKILAAVYGPRELHPKHLALPDRALVQCYYRMSTFSVAERKSPAPSRREREISKVISDALNSVILTKDFPRTTIDIYIQVLQADGGTRCASLTAACTALADAGIPMRGIISGVAAGLVNDTVVLDLHDIEDQKGSGDIPIGYSATLDEISLLQLDGVFTIKQFEEAVKLAIEGAKQIYEIQKKALREKYALIRAEFAGESEEEEAEEEDTIEIVSQSLAESEASVDETAIDEVESEELEEKKTEEVSEVEEVHEVEESVSEIEEVSEVEDSEVEEQDLVSDIAEELNDELDDEKELEEDITSLETGEPEKNNEAITDDSSESVENETEHKEIDDLEE